MDREIRRRAVIKEYQKGIPKENIALMFGLKLQTVNDYIREERHTETGLLSRTEEVLANGHKRTIMRWMRKQAGRAILTPLGTMTVVEVYPYIVRLYDKYIGYTTFTLGEVYYLNVREMTAKQAWGDESEAEDESCKD